MNAGNFGLEVLQILSPVFLAALTWGASKLAQLVRAKVQNEDLRGLLIRLDEAVLTTVKDLQQTLVDKLKAASADGKITEAEKKQIKSTAIAAVRSNLGTKGLDTVAKVFGSKDAALEGLLSSKIEAVVHDLRSTAPPPSPPAPSETSLPSLSAA